MSEHRPAGEHECPFCHGTLGQCCRQGAAYVSGIVKGALAARPLEREACIDVLAELECRIEKEYERAGDADRAYCWGKRAAMRLAYHALRNGLPPETDPIVAGGGPCPRFQRRAVAPDACEVCGWNWAKHLEREDY